MKKLALISISFIAICIAITSCSKDSDVLPSANDLTGNFEVYIDGNLLSKATTANVGMIQDNQGNYQNLITISNDEISIAVFQFPRTVGDVIAMEEDTDPGVTVTTTELYTTISGTLTRESASKITFDGKCTKLLDPQEYTITGSVEANAWKVIK